MSSSQPDDMKELRQAWVKVAITVGNDKDALVKCPVCKVAYLEIFDAFAPDLVRFERHMLCPNCNAYNALLMQVT